MTILGLLLFSFLNINFYTDSSIITKNNNDLTYIWHKEIKIANDTDFALQAEKEGWSGDGSQQNPYLIENLFFNITTGEYVGVAISINDVQSHFTIRQCFINLDYLNQNPVGIHLYNVKNALLEDNLIISSRYGISLISSQSILINNNNISFSGNGILSDNNNEEVNITNNIITSNIGYGIWIFGPASKFLIQNNTIEYNKRGIYITDPISDIIIRDNSLQNNEEAIKIEGDKTSGLEIKNNTGYSKSVIGFEMSIIFSVLVTTTVIKKKRID